jgi:O-antigen/teichoic acid export membrane protein
VAAHHERSLLVVSVSILIVNVALNLALIPRYGYKVAAVTSLASEACSVLLMVFVARARVGFRPSADYAPVLALACGVMVLLVVALPGPQLAAIAVGGIAYVAVLAALPGTVRWMLRDLVASARANRTGDPDYEAPASDS